MTIDNLYDIDENDIKRLVIFDVNKFKELEKEQEQNFEKLKKQEQYEKNSDKLTKTMVFKTNSIQNTIMNISKRQEELKNKIDMLREDYEKFNNFNDKIEDDLSALYELKLKKESLDKNSDEFKEIEKQEDELNIRLSGNQRQLKILVANFVELNRDEMTELLEKEEREEKEQAETEEVKEKNKKDDKRQDDTLEIKEFSMPKYNYDELMYIYEENMKNLLIRQDDIILSIDAIDEYIDNYDENSDKQDELEEKKEEKEILEKEQENIVELIRSLELIKTSILEIKQKQEQIEDLNISILDIKKKIEEQKKIIDDEGIEDNDDTKIQAKNELSKLKKEKNELVKSKNLLIKQINNIGEEIDKNFKNKFDKTPKKQNIKSNDFSKGNGFYEPVNYSNLENNDTTLQKNEQVETIQEKDFSDEKREELNNNLPVTNNKDIILEFISKIHISKDNGEEFLNKNFKGIVTALIYEKNLKSLTKQDKKDLKKALNKKEEVVCMQIGKLDLSNVDSVMHELFLDDIDSFKMYKDTQKDLFKNLYKSNLNNGAYIKEIGDLSKLDEKSIDFLNSFFSTYYKKIENGELSEDSDVCKCINRLIVSPVKLSVIKKYNKNIQSRFSYTLSKIIGKFNHHKACNKENLMQNLKNNIFYGEELKSSLSKKENDSLGIKSMVNDAKDISHKERNTIAKDSKSKDTLSI